MRAKVMKHFCFVTLPDGKTIKISSNSENFDPDRTIREAGSKPARHFFNSTETPIDRRSYIERMKRGPY